MALAACQAEPADPVPLSGPGDEALTCAEIADERAANRRAAVASAGRSPAADEGLGTLLETPGLSDRQKIEIGALADRNVRLERLAADQECGVSDAN